MIRRAFRYVKGLEWIWLSANLLMAGASLSAVMIPSILGRVFDDPSGYLTTGALLLAAMALNSLCGFGKTRLLARLSNRIAVRIRMSLMEKLMRVPQQFFVLHSSGELLSLAGNDVNLFRDALSGGLTYVLDTLLSLIMVLAVMIRIDALMTLLLLVSIGLIFCVNLLLTRGVTGVSADAQERLAQINSLASQGILGNQLLRAYRLEKIGLAMMERANISWEHSSLQLERIRARVGLIIGLLSAAQLVGLIVLGMQRVQAGLLTAGMLASFVLYAQSVTGPLSGASSLVVDVRKAFAAVRRLFAVLDEQEAAPGKKNLPTPVRGEIDIENLSFSYPSDPAESEKEVLREVSLTIAAGSTVALVGESGCGKTTLMQLIAGFLPAQQGEIRIDGLTVEEIEPSSLRDAVAVVSQQPFLFQLTVRDNIACGKPNATDAEIIRAAKLACAHDFILALPNGYQTVLGENGVNLSGGQRQRIAIARAFLKNAPILLLDEATSALDNRAEAEIQRSLERLMSNRTTLIIAHRLSTVRHADCIHYMENGRIIASGPHDELMKRCPEYRKMNARGTEEEL